jgi:hypothetical protein
MKHKARMMKKRRHDASRHLLIPFELGHSDFVILLSMSLRWSFVRFWPSNYKHCARSEARLACVLAAQKKISCGKNLEF